MASMLLRKTQRARGMPATTSLFCPPKRSDWRNIPISNNVGGVKHVFEHTSACTPRRAPFRSRRWFCAFQPGLASNRPGQELSPTQPSLRSLTAIMITCSNSPVLGSGMPNHYIGDLLLTIAMSGLSRVRTELLQLCVVHALAPHPVQMHRQLACHGHLGNLPPSSHGKVKEPTSPLRLTSYCDLRCFHQE